MENNTGVEAGARSSEVLGDLEEILCKEGKSKATVKKYVGDAGRYLQYVRDKYGSEAQAFDQCVLEEYRSHMLSVYKVSSVNSKIVSINCMLKVKGREDLRLSPCRMQRAAFRDEGCHLSKDDYRELISEAESEGNERLSLIIQTLGSTGIRISELQYITVESLESRCATVSLKGKTRDVILPEKLCEKLRKYTWKRGIAEGTIFVTRNGKPVDRSNVLHDLKRISSNTGVDPRKVHPHNFRHLFAETYYGMYKDISNLADILGHSNINTTRIYTARSRSELERSIEKMGLL